ncbi:MAG TPA: molybdopterin-dependent oxidoreductase [Thermoanaerobaculia bacterium]|jgi:DMSO/TMAO reductase YedYZ molybdopterin-dependent catalytic subunit|nr:molybdopterin-dependent oxidoreductase [Thermoanaerobaculia bacterium]
MAKGSIKKHTRRDFILFGAGTAITAAGFWWLMPDGFKQRHSGLHWLDSLEARVGLTPDRRERFLNRALTFDDDVAEALYSPGRRVRTYKPSDVTALKNNYHGPTPGPGYLADWKLTLTGLASGREEVLRVGDLLRFPHRDQVTRLCCVEGWSAIAWWGGLRFADLLRAHPPRPGARYAAMSSEVTDYYVSIDLPTAEHPQTLLATHQNNAPLTLAHGAPLRLVVPMKLGLKNIKAITRIAYVQEEPRDFWAERGYSRYDGL